MARSSNLMPQHPAATCKIRQLTWDKIEKVDEGVVITLVLEKTIQRRERLHKIALKQDTNNPLCPVKCLEDLIEMRGGRDNIPVDDLVLMLPDGEGGFKPLCKYELNSWYKHRIAQLGLDETKYFLHGFRHGSLAEALAIEPNIALIRVTSNHLSSAIFTYSNIDPNKRFQVSAKMMDSLSQLFTPVA